MSKRFYQRTKLKKHQLYQSVGGKWQAQAAVNDSTIATIKSRTSTFEVALSFLIETITQRIPLESVETRLIPIPKNVILADPSYHQPQDIGILLGAGVYFDLLCTERIKIGKNRPTLQSTKLGWIIGGPCIESSRVKQAPAFCGLAVEIDMVEKFWRIEECHGPHPLSKEETDRKLNFIETHEELRTEDL